MPDEMKTVANNGIYQKDYSVAGTIEGGPAPKGIWDTVKDTVSSIGDSVERINTTLADPNANIMDKLTTVTGELGIHDSLQKFSRYTDMYTMSRANDNNLAGYLYASIYAKPNYDAVKRDKAIEIGSKLHISPDVILTASEDGFARAIDISNQMDRGKTYEEVTREYPELLHLRYDSLASAEKTFDDVQNVNKTKGVFDSIQQSLWAMNDQLLLGYAGYKLAETTDEADRQTILQEIDRLQNNLQQYRTTDVADLGSKIVGDSVAQLYMMGVQAFKGSNRAVQGMGVGATLGAVSGSALGGVGAAPGAVAGGITGLTYGAQVGMAEQMYQTSFGKKYIDLIQKKDANGRNVYSHDEAYSMAQKFAAIDTGIEFFAMRVGAKAVVKATPASRMVVQALTTGVDTTVSAINKGMGAIVGQAVKRGVKAGIPELVEEGLQDVNEKVQHNLFRKANDPEGSYSVGDIASGALGAMVQAAPSVIGIAGLGSIAGGLRARHDLRKWQRLTPEEQTALLQEEQNRNAHTLMTNIRNDARTNKIAQENPEIYGQLVQTYAQKVQVPTAYINVHEMVETPEGQQAIRELVNAGIVSNERVAKSIEAETPIEVPLGQFAQKATDLSDNAMEAIKNTTYYTEGGRSMRRIQKEKESYEQARQDVHEELKNHKANVKRDIINEYVPDASAYQKEILNDVLDDYDHVAQTYHTILLEAQAEFREKYNRQYQNIKQAEKNGVSIPYVSMDGINSNVITPEAERMRVIVYNRQLEKESVKNDPEATAMIDQIYDEMELASKSIRDIEGLEGAVDEIAKGDVAMRMNFSKDGYQVFQDVYNTLRQSPNREVAKQAKEGALLFASHADVMANIMQKAGKWNFTAKDYMDRYISIQMGDTKQIKNGFTQPLNPGVDPKTEVEVVSITLDRYHSIHKMKNSELANYLRDKFKGIAFSKDKLATLGIKDYKGAQHIAWNLTHKNRAIHRSLLDNLKSVVENAVLVESAKNRKKDFTAPVSNAQKRKNEVEYYHRFYVPVSINGKIYVVRVVGEERHGNITVNPTSLDLYSIIVENKKLERGLHSQSDKSVAVAPNKITIQEMLSGVKDMNGNSYIDSNENSEYYQSHPSGVTKQQVVEAKAKLKADTEAWGTLIDAFKANKVTGNRHRVMSMPLVYQMIGMSNKDIYIENNIINKVINKKHANKIKLELVKQLPEALAHPIAVFKNYDPKKDQVKSNSFISIIEIKSEEGKLTNIPIVFDKNKNGNFIMSIFPREHDTWYEQQLKHDRLLYIDRTKKDSISVGGKSKPSHTEMLSIDDSIPNEEDLRKLKEENTSYYQSQPSGVTKQQVVEAKAKLKADTANWSKVIDNLDSYDAGMQVRVMTTPLALQLAGAKPYEVVMGVGKIRKIMKEHPEITKAGIKNLIQQLSDPIAVFESKTQKGSIIAMVQLKYPVNNANVIIPIKLDADSSRGTYKVNVITSTYARYNKKTLDPSISWYKNILEGKAEKACYLNTKKITDWYSVNRLQLPSTEYHISDFFTYTIPNEEDLRKLKEENTSYYQSVRGVTSMYDDGRKLVELFDSANFSTFVHESGHVFLEDLRMLANMEGAPREVVSDWEAIKTWTGYQEGADADTNRTAHERFAQGFEAYVRDGSAPTKSLQRAFRQFAKWLTKLYQKVSMLGGLPPKEIREVMDRMLATEQDIESWANEREVERLETNDHMQNLSEQEQALLHDKVASIKERAKEKVRAEYMKEMEEQKKVPWEEVKGEAQARIEKGLVERYPIYRERARYEAFGIDALIHTNHPTLESLEEAEETEGIGKWHVVVNEQLHAAEESYQSSDRNAMDNADMAEKWLLTHQAEQRLRMAEADMIKDEIRKACARHYRALATLQRIDTSEGDVEQPVTQALHELTERERKRIEKGLAKEADKKDALIAKLQSRVQDMSRLRDMHTESLHVAMGKAKNKLAGLTVSQATKYKRFVRESVTAGKHADIAFSKGQLDVAYQLKQEQLMKTAMARVAFEIHQEMDKERTKLVQQLQRISSSKSTVKLEPQARYWYQHMMYQLGMSNRDGILPADGQFDIASVYAVLDADTLLSDTNTKEIVPPSVHTVWASKEPIPYHQLSVKDVRDIVEIMHAIYHNGRTDYKGVTIKDDTGQSISIDQAAQELVEQLEKTMGGIPDQDLLDKLTSETWKTKVSHSISGNMLELAKVESILNRCDGGVAGGSVWYRYIYEPINRATNEAKKRTEIAMKWLSLAISQSYSPKELFEIRNVRRYTLGDVRNLTKEQIITAALNWGTEANRQRVLETFSATEVEVEKIFSNVLTDTDWNFIESTWNHINSYFDERNQVQERLYGTPMKKEEGVAFTIAGRKIQGQYYPIVYDPRLDNKSSDYAIEDVIKSQMSSNAVMGMGLSATKKRLTTVKGKKLMLSLDVIPSAITESINHIAMREAVTDVNKLIQHHEVERAIVQTLGRDAHQYIKQWVRDNWQTEISKTSRWDRTLSTLRKNSTMAVMAYRTSTALLNVLNIIPAMHKMGAINALSAVKSFYFGGPITNRRFVMSKSLFLRERIQNLDKDMKNGMKIDGTSPFSTGGAIDETMWRTQKMQEEINRYGYFFITETDLMLSMPIWMHEYESKKAELVGKSGYSPEEIENRAIEAGDRMVRSIFGSGDTKDQAGVQRKNHSLVGIFTPFYSYSSTVFNALLEAGWLAKDSGNWWKLAHAFLFWIVLQSVAEALLRSLWDNDKDTPKTIAKKSVSAIGSATVQGFPIVRDILGAAGGAITGDTITNRGSEVVALSMTSKLTKVLGDALLRQDKVSATDIGRSASEVVNRLIPGGFSDTLTDGAWTMAKWLLTDMDATILDMATAVIMDKKIRTRKEQKKYDTYIKRQEHKNK